MYNGQIRYILVYTFIGDRLVRARHFRILHGCYFNLYNYIGDTITIQVQIVSHFQYYVVKCLQLDCCVIICKGFIDHPYH